MEPNQEIITTPQKSQMQEISPRSIGIILFCITIIFVCIPFLMVTFVPATDLPQHLAQIRLFYDLLSNSPPEGLTITFFNANVLVYWILALLWLIFPPILTGKLMMLGLVLSWILAIYLLAWKTQRSFASATLAATLVFNANLYWGFINFLIGFPLFALWYVFVVHPVGKEAKWNHSILIVLLTVLLFLAHALWLAVSIATLAMVDVRRRISWSTFWMQCAGIAPILFLAAIWFPSLSSTRAQLHFDTAPHWLVSPLERLHPQWIVNSLYGGLHNPIEWILFIALCGWILVSIYTNRKNLKEGLEWDLLATGALFLCIVYFAPEKYVNTIYFASRWYPVAMIFILLSLPQPKISLLYQSAFAILMIVILSVVTGFSWKLFEREENSGLQEALDKLPQNVRVLGLDFVQESQILCGRPFMQTFAYAQALRGGELNFSFALHQSGIVSTKLPLETPTYTSGLEWFPEWVHYEDFASFDYTLINANDDLHAILEQLPVLKPVTKTGRWRLYECQKGTGLQGAVFKLMN